MWRILQYSVADDYVLATGVSITVREFVERVFTKLGIDISWSGSGVEEVGKNENGNVVIRIDPTYFRPTEVPFLLGDSTKARTKLGWEPIYTLDMLIDEMVGNEMEGLG